MLRKVLCSVLGLLAGFLGCPRNATADRLVQVGNWSIERLAPTGEAAPLCRASTTVMLPDALYFTWDVSVALGPGEAATVVVQKTNPDPEWLEFPGERQTGEKVVAGCRFWFDDRTMWPMQYVLDRETGACRYDLRADPQFAEEFAASRALKLETRPGAVTEEKGVRFVTGGHLSVLGLVNSPGVVQELRKCLVSLGRSEAFSPVTLPNPVSPPVAYTPMPARLEAARQAVQQTRSDDAASRIPALVALGQAAADALRLVEARDALLAAQHARIASAAPLTPALRQGLERLVLVLVVSEQLEDAASVARTLPENEPLLGAIAMAKGEYAAAEQLFCTAASRILGQPVRDWNALSMRDTQDVPMAAADRLSAKMRELLQWWAMAALGQERALVDKDCTNCTVSITGHLPASLVADLTGKWLDSAMLRDGDAAQPQHRRELGLAAYLRGACLLRAGYLLSVKTDLSYAQFELERGSGADGWAWQAALGLAELAAAQGRTAEALATVRTAAGRIAADLGRQSRPWLEAAALQSEWACRMGDAAAAVAAARDGLEAVAGLPPAHSLVLRLNRALGRALLAQNKPLEAATATVKALGFSQVPALTGEQAQRLNQQMLAVPSGPLSPPTRIPDPAVLDHNAAAQAKATHARAALLSNAVGLPPVSESMPVTARFERVQFAPLLLDIGKKLDRVEWQYGCLFASRAVSFTELEASDRRSRSFLGGDLGYVSHLRELGQGDDPLARVAELAVVTPKIHYFESNALVFYTSALEQLRLSAMLPGQHRQTLLPGPVLDGLEALFTALRKMATVNPGGLDGNLLHQALVDAQAASRGEVLANLLVRAVLVADPAIRQEDRDEAKRAIEGELWLRRQRGLLLDAIRYSGRPGHSREAIRRMYLPLPYYTLAVGTKFDAHIFGKGGQADKAFMNMTWFGSVQYEVKTEVLQARLADDEAVVVWLPLEHGTQLFVIKKDACQWLVLPEGQAVLGQRVQAIRRALADLRAKKWNPAAVPFPETEAYALYRSLFGPMEAILTGVHHLYTAQLGVTGGLPLSLLVTRPPTAGQEPSWLVDRFAITRMPALINPGVFDRKSPPPATPGRLLLAAGDPVVKASLRPADEVLVAAARSVSDIDALPSLTETRREMNTVATLLGLTAADREQDVLAGPVATRQAVLDRLHAGRYKYLLFATHGLVQGEDIGEPALVLSPQQGKRTPTDDGLLRASDVVGMTLDTDLVILSACETSPSGEDGAEPLAGLASAFLVAGAREVLSTQWPVVTDAAEAVSTAMISGLQAGRQKPAVILQHAMQQLRTQGKPGSLQRHPAYWAPFESIAFPK